MSCGTCGLQASATLQADTGVPAGAPQSQRPRCPRCRAFLAAYSPTCYNPRCPSLNLALPRRDLPPCPTPRTPPALVLPTPPPPTLPPRGTPHALHDIRPLLQQVAAIVAAPDQHQHQAAAMVTDLLAHCRDDARYRADYGLAQGLIALAQLYHTYHHLPAALAYAQAAVTLTDRAAYDLSSRTIRGTARQQEITVLQSAAAAYASTNLPAALTYAHTAITATLDLAALLPASVVTPFLRDQVTAAAPILAAAGTATQPTLRHRAAATWALVYDHTTALLAARAPQTGPGSDPRYTQTDPPPDDSPTLALHATAAYECALCATAQQDLPRAITCYTAAAAAYADSHQPASALGTRTRLALLLQQTGDHPAALTTYEQVLRAYEQSGDQRGQAVVTYLYAQCLAAAGYGPVAAAERHRFHQLCHTAHLDPDQLATTISATATTIVAPGPSAEPALSALGPPAP